MRGFIIGLMILAASEVAACEKTSPPGKQVRSATAREAPASCPDLAQLKKAEAERKEAERQERLRQRRQLIRDRVSDFVNIP